MSKFEAVKGRLRTKVRISATPISGFMVGLSGTDSILTYILLGQLGQEMGFVVNGVHYVDDKNVPDTFNKYAESWLSAQMLGTITNVELPTGNHDQYRWADLHYRAVNRVETDGYLIDPSANRYWVASTVNATEKALGTYSILAKSASIEPIVSFYKSEVLEACKELGVPDQIIHASQIPDCLCGRDEFAAENIRLIDDVLRNQLSQDYSMDSIKKAMDYINDAKKHNGFKQRTPYNV